MKKSIKKEYNLFLNTEEGIKAYNDFKNILYKPSDTLIETFNEKVMESLVNNTGQIKICDIGGGDGKRIIHILSFLKELYPELSVQLDFIEQSKLFCESFRQNTSKIESFCNVTIFDELFENVDFQDKSYDMVFLIHSIFAFEDEMSINKIRLLIKDSGKIVFMSNAKDSFLAKLKSNLDKGYVDKRFEIDELESILKKNSIEFDKYSFDTEFKIHERDIEKETEKILNWLSLGRYKLFSSKEQIEMKDLLLSYGVKMKDDYYFKEKENLLIIPPVNISAFSQTKNTQCR